MMDTITKKTRCPFCDKAHDLASNMTGKGGPDDGDVTLCVGCGEWAFFDSTVEDGLRVPTPDEYTELATSQKCRELRVVWVMMDQERSRQKPGDRAAQGTPADE